MPPTHRFQVLSTHNGLRIDQAISAHLPEVSRGLAKKTLDAGGVFVDKKRVKIAARIVYKGQQVEVNLPQVAVLKALKSTQPTTITLVEQTEMYLIVDKPSGVFSAPTQETDQNDLLHFLRMQLNIKEVTSRDKEEQSLYLVHRLDRPTSGLMVLARTKAAATELSAQLVSRQMSRQYLALLVGSVPDEISVEKRIQEKEARTDFVLKEFAGGLSLVEAKLQTGRTHQVRIHAEHLSAPVAGDSKYGRRLQRVLPSRPPRMALHASVLELIDPTTGRPKRFESEFPPELTTWWRSIHRGSTSD